MVEKMFDKFKVEATRVKHAAKKYAEVETPLEKKLREAMSNENWGCPNSILYEITVAAQDYTERTKIVKRIEDKLQSNTRGFHEPHRWCRILKALTLLEYIIKNASEEVLPEFLAQQHAVGQLQHFSLMEDGKERGTPVRDKAKAVVELMSNQADLKLAREEAKEHRMKMLGGSVSESISGSYRSSSKSYDPPHSRDSRMSMEQRFNESKKKRDEELQKKERPPPPATKSTATGRLGRRAGGRDGEDEGRGSDDSLDPPRGRRGNRSDTLSDSDSDRSPRLPKQSRAPTEANLAPTSTLTAAHGSPEASPVPPPADMLDLFDEPAPAAGSAFQAPAATSSDGWADFSSAGPASGGGPQGLDFGADFTAPASSLGSSGDLLGMEQAPAEPTKTERDLFADFTFEAAPAAPATAAHSDPNLFGGFTSAPNSAELPAGSSLAGGYPQQPMTTLSGGYPQPPIFTGGMAPMSVPAATPAMTSISAAPTPAFQGGTFTSTSYTPF